MTTTLTREERIAELKERISYYEDAAEAALEEAAKIRSWNEGTEKAEEAIRDWMQTAEQRARIAESCRNKLAEIEATVRHWIEVFREAAEHFSEGSHERAYDLSVIAQLEAELAALEA